MFKLPEWNNEVARCGSSFFLSASEYLLAADLILSPNANWTHVLLLLVHGLVRRRFLLLSIRNRRPLLSSARRSDLRRLVTSDHSSGTRHDAHVGRLSLRHLFGLGHFLRQKQGGQ